MTHLKCNENILLWDGKHYCASLLKHIAPELYNYRKHHDTLYSKQISPHDKMMEYYSSQKSKVVISFLAATIFTVTAATSPVCQERPILILLIWLSIFAISFSTFVIGNGICNIRMAFAAPLISVKNGDIFIVYYRRIIFPFYSKNVCKTPSHIIAIIKETGPHFASLIESTTFFLDVTDVYEQLKQIHPRYFIATEEDGQKKYYLGCCIDKSLKTVWESYVALTHQSLCLPNECDCPCPTT